MGYFQIFIFSNKTGKTYNKLHMTLVGNAYV